jgi:hypothetical protein
VRQHLPSRIQEQLETPVSGVGDFLVLCAESPNHEQSDESIIRLVRLNGRTYRAAVYGRRLNQTTKYSIPLHGVALDDVLALHENVLAELEPGETPDSTDSIVDVVTDAGQPAALGSRILARLGGQIYRFNSRDHLKRIEAHLQAAESGLDPNPVKSAASLLEEGPVAVHRKEARRSLAVVVPPGRTQKRILIVRVDFPDLTMIMPLEITTK